MDADTRKRVILSNEGQLIQIASHNESDGADIVRCHIDGAANALIRIEGREEAARYFFALSDRVVGGLREPTHFLPVVPTVCAPPDSKITFHRDDPGWLVLFRAVFSRLLGRSRLAP